jgi:hypothetical protein
MGQEETEMKKFEGEGAIVQQMNQVLERMPGCPEPDCHACRANRTAILDLVAVVKNNALTDVLKKALEEGW